MLNLSITIEFMMQFDVYCVYEWSARSHTIRVEERSSLECFKGRLTRILNKVRRSKTTQIFIN